MRVRGKTIKVGPFSLIFWTPGYQEPPPPSPDRTPLWYPGSLALAYRPQDGSLWGAHIMLFPPSISWPQRILGAKVANGGFNE